MPLAKGSCAQKEFFYIRHLCKVVAHKKNFFIYATCARQLRTKRIFLYMPLVQGSCAQKEFYVCATCAR